MTSTPRSPSTASSRPASPGSALAFHNLGLALKQKDALRRGRGRAAARGGARPARCPTRPTRSPCCSGRRTARSEAAAACRATIERAPDHAEAHYLLGTVLRQQGDTDGAIAEFRETIRIQPTSAEAHLSLGQVLRRQGRARGERARRCAEAERLQPEESRPAGRDLRDRPRQASARGGRRRRAASRASARPCGSRPTWPRPTSSSRSRAREAGPRRPRRAPLRRGTPARAAPPGAASLGGPQRTRRASRPAAVKSRPAPRSSRRSCPWRPPSPKTRLPLLLHRTWPRRPASARRPSSAAGSTNRYLLETTGCGAAFFDYDDDGWLDVFLVNGTTLEGFPKGQEPTNHLYRNRGDGTFEDVTRARGARRERLGPGRLRRRLRQRRPRRTST